MTDKNLILITLDVFRGDMMSKEMTPLLYRHAKDKLIFTNCYSPSSMGISVVPSILSGCLPDKHGRVITGHEPFRKDLSFLSDYLPMHYSLAFNYGYYYNRREYKEQFDYFDSSEQLFLNPLKNKLSETVFKARGMIKGLNEFVSSEKIIDNMIKLFTNRVPQPFFCWFHLMDTHFPYVLNREPILSKRENLRFLRKFYNNERNRTLDNTLRVKSMYKDKVEYLDNQLNRLFDFLKVKNIYDKSLIIVVGTHGEEFAEHGGWQHSSKLYNEIIKVPLIIFDTEVDHGRIIEENVSALDVLPTVLDFFNVDIPEMTDGINLRSFYKSDLADIERDIFFEAGNFTCPERQQKLRISLGMRSEKVQGVISGCMKLIYYPETNNSELYDLSIDPNESSVINDAVVSKTLKNKILRKFKSKGEMSGRNNMPDRFKSYSYI